MSEQFSENCARVRTLDRSARVSGSKPAQPQRFVADSAQSELRDLSTEIVKLEFRRQHIESAIVRLRQVQAQRVS